MAIPKMQDTAVYESGNSDLDAQAAKYFGKDLIPVQVEFGALSDRGLMRSNNEDHYSVVRRYRAREVLLTNLPPDVLAHPREEVYAFAVADGIGGAAFGELASMLALRTGWELTGKAFKWAFKLSEAEIAEVEQTLKVYMRLIDRRVKKEASKSPDHQGMGTTLTGALTVGLDAFIVHVGDSRAYLYRAGTLHRLTRDQTLAESMVAIGLIPSIDEAAQRFRNTLVSCLGGELHQLEVATSHLKLQDGDHLMLCTDGLTDMVSEADIATILADESTCQNRCQKLIDAALAGGGCDNVTVVLGRYLVDG